MKLPGISRTLSLVALAVIASPSAVADSQGWYVGGNVGQARADIDDERIARSLGAGFTSIDEDDDDTGYKLFTGYQFSRYFALEVGLFELGEFGFTANSATGTLSGVMELRGLNLDAVGILPFTEKFYGLGRIGANYAESKTSFSSTGAVATPPDSKERDWNPKVGLGLGYDFTPSWGMRAEVERYRINDAVGNDGDIDLASLGLIYRFGVMAPAPAPAAYVAAPEPAPRPVVVQPPPPPPPPTKVAFSADALFDFDKAILKPLGKQALDAFAADLRNTDYDVIRVTGHTDRIGSDAYNMRLSTRRAEAVRDYLVDTAGIPASKMVGRGMGESEPVTKPGECSEARTRENIACLQPDRRVEVEVTGTAPR